ncbi:hypothetical protein [Phytoactinopolyspora halotolerans]|uniref:hypothetical protein n=1 Tax=Phytoactinopolyspora halotolerans TaxID=1981512 RepID=UPI001C2019D7|nr:hypothetical protein [Phytoactinopolyspora halotolerans]
MFPRRFALVRHVDYTGISGVGVVAYGVVFADGHVALRWCSDHPATSLWNSIDDLIAVHGHGDGTSVQWIDSATDRLHEAMEAMEAPRGGRRRKGAIVDEVPRQPSAPQTPEETIPETPPPPPDEPFDEPAVPAPRHGGGRHRRRSAPAEESAAPR